MKDCKYRSNWLPVVKVVVRWLPWPAEHRSPPTEALAKGGQGALSLVTFFVQAKKVTKKKQKSTFAKN
jgi:hypothetical protein